MFPRQLVESEEWCSELEVCAKCRTFSTTMFLVSLEVDFLMQNIYRVGLKDLHGFEFLSAAPQLPTYCLTAMFGKIGRKSSNHVKAF